MDENCTNKAVFFDIDDTLLDTSSFAETARRAAINNIVENGLPIEEDEAYDIFKEIIAEKGSNYDKHFNVLTKRVIGAEDPYLIALGMTTYHNVKFSLLQPFPRTIAILIYLKTKGYKLGAITNGLTIKQWEKLIRLNLHPFFDIVLTSEEVGYEKPHPEIFKEALRRMNCSADKSVMVGNKYETDIVGALNAGMAGILVNSELTFEQEQEIEDKNLNVTVLNNISDVDTVL
ncbi:haloacid dehalogenase [Methanobrevibacter sp. 87.7]|uniref:TIGR02253 family HAD-type hydrolase n=1 Tax=Methanobrevibacter sp. 87.7 TaxID=387957 RepID=UPI000B50E035|nr:TIGR02253 family HAD-type hydrolase [Methanobrevibacter sp. 87.7]OWT33475.1 haloacid dehalogenase [Methanobrevibacter sp. 87.7]